jgi:hypothetical protein
MTGHPEATRLAKWAVSEHRKSTRLILPGTFSFPGMILRVPITSNRNQTIALIKKQVKVTDEELLGIMALHSWKQVIGCLDQNLAALTATASRL